MKRFIAFSILVLLLIGCVQRDDDDLPPGKRAGGFKIADENKQSQILERMKKMEIPYHVDEDGFVRYLLKNKAEVLGIQREVDTGGVLNSNAWESAVITTNYQQEQYETAFQRASIPYKIDTYQGTLHISWNQLDGPKVDKIIQSVEISVMDYYIEGAKNK